MVEWIYDTERSELNTAEFWVTLEINPHYLEFKTHENHIGRSHKKV